jgi:Na+/proline symporter
MNQLSERELHQHVLIVAWLNIVSDATVLMLGLCGFAFFAGIGSIAALDGDPTALGILGLIGVIAVMFFGALALPGLLAGYGLLKRRKWGQILGMVVGLLNLPWFPLGTAIGAYTLFVLLQNSANAYFEHRDAV